MLVPIGSNNNPLFAHVSLTIVPYSSMTFHVLIAVHIAHRQAGRPVNKEIGLDIEGKGYAVYGCHISILRGANCA